MNSRRDACTSKSAEGDISYLMKRDIVYSYGIDAYCD